MLTNLNITETKKRNNLVQKELLLEELMMLQEKLFLRMAETENHLLKNGIKNIQNTLKG